MKTTAQLVAECSGYNPQAMRADQVKAFLAELVEPLQQVETVGIFAALGRVLAADVISPISVPPHDNSAMDGYAFAGAQLDPAKPLALRLVGTVLAGQSCATHVAADECVRIMTGAVLPLGLDTVVPQELVTLTPGASGALAQDLVRIPAGVVQRGDNRRCLGEDLRQGQPALRQGALLTSAALGLIASLGISQVSVMQRLKVAYFSTGDEIFSLGQPLRAGAVYDSNRYTLFGLLNRLGCQVIDFGVVGDQVAALEAVFRQAAQQAQVVITSGGVSVGAADHTREMMNKLGDVVFWQVAMRPGRPLAVGRIHSTPPANAATTPSQSDAAEPLLGRAAAGSAALLFGLPGNPVAVMVTFLAFVRPALLRMMGCTDLATPLMQARSSEVIRKKPGRTEYQRGVVSRSAVGELQVRSTGNQGSGVLSSMVQANALIVLAHDQGSVAVGEMLDVLLLDALL